MLEKISIPTSNLSFKQNSIALYYLNTAATTYPLFSALTTHPKGNLFPPHLAHVTHTNFKRKYFSHSFYSIPDSSLYHSYTINTGSPDWLAGWLWCGPPRITTLITLAPVSEVGTRVGREMYGTSRRTLTMNFRYLFISNCDRIFLYAVARMRIDSASNSISLVTTNNDGRTTSTRAGNFIPFALGTIFLVLF